MKKKNNIIIILVLVFQALVFTLTGQTTFIVTDNVMGNPGSYDKKLVQAIASANAGNNATLLFNAPGLCEVKNNMANINITNGSLTLTKSPLATTSQGFKSSATIPPFLVVTAISIANNSVNTSVTVKNLLFTKLNSVSSPINIANAKNVLIENCRFEEYCQRLVISASDNITVTNCTFYYIANSGASKPGILMTESGAKLITSNYHILNNTFYDSDPSIAPIPSNPGNAIVFWNFMNANIKDNIEIKNNTINNYASGIWVINGTNNISSVDNTLQLDIQNNTILAYSMDVGIEKPYKHFIVNNNNLTIIPDVMSPTANIYLYAPVVAPNSPFGLDFINTNSIGLPLKNENNIFQSTPLNANNYNVVSYKSFETFGQFDKENKIVGLNLPGRIIIGTGKNTLIRQNKIISNGNGNPSLNANYADSPITLAPNGNGSILKPVLNSANLSTISGSNYLNVTYTLPGLSNLNSGFVVDFYKSNGNGDLLDYIGNFYISSLASSYTSNIPIPSSVSLPVNGARIAVTVTSLGNTSAHPLGTSKASYITITAPCPTIQSFTHQTLSPNPCTKIEYNASVSNQTGQGLTVNVNFGDGSPSFNSTMASTDVGFAGSHTFTTTGTYTLTFTINGPGNCSSKLTQTVSVICNPCPTVIGANYQINPCVATAASGDCQGKCKSIEGFLILSNSGSSTYSVTMNYGDGSAVNTTTTTTNPNSITNNVGFIHPYNNGTYTVTATIKGPGACISTYTFVVNIICTPPPCSDCIGSFAPIPDSTYIISAWVKETGATINTTTYTNANINVSFRTGLTGSSGSSPIGTPVLAMPAGLIIDGWQKIEQKFKIPAGAAALKIDLQSTVDANFDDIRVFPFNGSMKSYVYDPLTMRLMAELDERNYATFYEYDEEGKLIRVKKETEKGIMTIKESRNSTPVK